MARVCSVCVHKARHAIDMALVDPNASARAIARQYGLTASAIHRHATTHVPKVLASLATRVGVLESDQLLAQTLSLYERGLELLAEAEVNVAAARTSQDKSRALAAASGAIREARHTIDTLARVNLSARQDDQAAQSAVSSVENELRPDLDAEIAERLRRRGMPSTGPRARASTEPAPMLQLPAARTDTDVVDAELVD